MTSFPIVADEEKRTLLTAKDASHHHHHDDPTRPRPKKISSINTLKPRRSDGPQKSNNLLRFRRTRVLIFTLLVLVGIRFISRLEIASRTHDAKAVAWLASNSSDNALRLVKLYPDLDESASTECKQAWRKAAATLDCHHDILSAGLDHSNATEAVAAGIDPLAATQRVCNINCARELSSLKEALREPCKGRLDRFNVGDYGRDGFAYFQVADMEEGPRQVAEMLDDRHLSLCAWGLGVSEWGPCGATVWKRWGAVWGTRLANMNGVYEFLERTNIRKTVGGHNMTGIRFGPNSTSVAAEVAVPVRQVGPGVNETDCEYCTIYWLKSKMHSFEVGKVLDLATGKAMTRQAFHDVMASALERCRSGIDWPSGGRVVERVRRTWARLGYWCDGKACEEDAALRDAAQRVFHGLRRHDVPLPWIRERIQAGDAPTRALQALHAGLERLPCSIWFDQHEAMQHIVPQYPLINHVCGGPCRNAVDRMQAQHGHEFAAAARSMAGDNNVFQAWDKARRQLDQLCLSIHVPAVRSQRERIEYCGPGYAALGRPEWLFRNTAELDKAEILAAFAPAVDALAAVLPPYSADFVDYRHRILSSSVANMCASRLLVPGEPVTRQTIADFIDAEGVDGREYARVVKRLHGLMVRTVLPDHSPRVQHNKAAMYEALGLNRYEHDTDRHYPIPKDTHVAG